MVLSGPILVVTELQSVWYEFESGKGVIVRLRDNNDMFRNEKEIAGDVCNCDKRFAKNQSFVPLGYEKSSSKLHSCYLQSPVRGVWDQENGQLRVRLAFGLKRVMSTTVM